jgi:hypothetical protein
MDVKDVMGAEPSSKDSLRIDDSENISCCGSVSNTSSILKSLLD